MIFRSKPIWVPLVDRTARYLSGTESRSGSRVVDSFLELRTAKERSVSVEVTDPDGKRPLSLNEASSAENYQLTPRRLLRIAPGQWPQGYGRRESGPPRVRPVADFRGGLVAVAR